LEDWSSKGGGAFAGFARLRHQGGEQQGSIIPKFKKMGVYNPGFTAFTRPMLSKEANSKDQSFQSSKEGGR
jgi:hypothetical protein